MSSRIAYVLVQIQVPLRGRESPSSIKKYVVERIKDAGFVSEVISSSHSKDYYAEDRKVERRSHSSVSTQAIRQEGS